MTQTPPSENPYNDPPIQPLPFAWTLIPTPQPDGTKAVVFRIADLGGIRLYGMQADDAIKLGQALVRYGEECKNAVIVASAGDSVAKLMSIDRAMQRGRG